MNDYYSKCLDFQEKLKEYASNIFRTYGRELVLGFEEYYLLQNIHNYIESSTAIGFVLEEFIVSKLEMYTHCAEEEYKIDRFVGATASESYDCFSYKDNIKFLVNIKAESGGSANNAVAAIQQLHRNYCLEESNIEKSYIIFKIKYEIRDAYEDDDFRRAKPRHIYIKSIESFSLEEVDLSNGHKQDNRSWSRAAAEKSKNNGRLIISPAFREKHKVNTSDISYQNTCDQLNKLVTNNI